MDFEVAARSPLRDLSVHDFVAEAPCVLFRQDISCVQGIWRYGGRLSGPSSSQNRPRTVQCGDQRQAAGLNGRACEDATQGTALSSCRSYGSQPPSDSLEKCQKGPDTSWVEAS